MTTESVPEVGLLWGSAGERVRFCISGPKAAKIMDGEFDGAIASDKGRRVEVLKLVVGTKSHFIAVRVDVGYSNVPDGDIVQIGDPGGEDGPGWPRHESNAAS